MCKLLVFQLIVDMYHIKSSLFFFFYHFGFIALCFPCPSIVWLPLCLFLCCVEHFVLFHFFPSQLLCPVVVLDTH